jgi:membrane protein
MGRWLAALKDVLKHLLEAEVSQLSRGQARIAYLLKLVVETWSELRRDKCFVHASSLAYKSLLSLVPFMVILLTVSSVPPFEGYQDDLLQSVVDHIYPVDEERIRDLQSRHPGAKEDLQSADELRSFVLSSQAWLKERMRAVTTQGGAARGLISLFFLALIIVFLMSDIEGSFNHIWGMSSGRPLLSKVASYTAVLTWGPLFLILSFVITGWAKSVVAEPSQVMISSWAILWIYDVLRSVLLGLVLPVFFLWLMLLGLYLWMPNTRVRRRPSMMGSLIAALLLHAAKWAFGMYVVNVVSYDRVYGTLSVVPVMLIWLYVSWVIILFGAEVAFTIQNFRDLTSKAERERRGIRLRLYYAVRTVYTVCRRFTLGESPEVLDELASEFQIAEYALRSVIEELVAHGILAKVEGEADAFVPARSPDTLTVKDVVDALHGTRLESPATADTVWIDRDPVRDVIHRLFRRYERAAEEQLGSLSFGDLVRRVAKARPRQPGPSAGGEADTGEAAEQDPGDAGNGPAEGPSEAGPGPKGATP